MKKLFYFIMFAGILLGITSCASSKGLFSNDYSVAFDKILEEIQTDAAKMEQEQSYQKSFTAKDKMGNFHDVVIYDDHYMRIDNVFYAYEFRNLMYYSLSLNTLSGSRTVSGTDKVWGIQGYATAINNPDATISFIIAKDMFKQKAYTSMYEARQISGVAFMGLDPYEGYIDDFGYWKSYGWTDYFEHIFNTTNKDVKKKMYIAIDRAEQ